MSVSRRHLIQRSAVALAAAHLPPLSRAQGLEVPRGGSTDLAERAARVDPGLVKGLALRAVEAAKAAGAQYADVRLTRTMEQRVANRFADSEERGVGVRCLVNGYWGFAASTVWTPDEMATLGRTATRLAQANAKGPQRVVEWTPVPVMTGDWTMPMELDPMLIPLEERLDYVGAGASLAGNGHSCSAWRQEQALATSEGSYCTTTHGQLNGFQGLHYSSQGQALYRGFKGMRPSGWGWELHRDGKPFEQVPGATADFEFFLGLPRREAELGRYDLVLDGEVTATLVQATLAKATELDRALGYEANATGTSYLGPDVLELLGRFQVGSPLLTLTANRSMPHAMGTMPWDAEGVVPEEVTLIKEGILVDYQTTREQAAWLAPYYAKVGKPVRSHGYAGSESALFMTQQQTPNLRLAPGTPGTPLAEMIKGIKKGIYCFWNDNGGIQMDFQGKTGILGWATQREIVNGKLGAVIAGRVLFNSVELWKSLVAVGPASEAAPWDFAHRKGQPEQTARYAVEAVPTHFKNVTVIR